MKTKTGQWAQWGSSAILSRDNSITVIASVNDSMSKYLCWRVSVQHGVVSTLDFVWNRTYCRWANIPTEKVLWRNHTTKKKKKKASEWYRTAKSSDNIRYGCQCSQKYPPLNLNKLYLQCPRREKQTRLSYKTSHAGKISKLWLGSTS